MAERSPKDVAKEIIASNLNCVLATSSLDGKPEAAEMEYAEDEEENIYFKTFSGSRKLSNVRENPRASVVITELVKSLQMDGMVEEVFGEEKEKAKGLLIGKQGEEKWYTDEDLKFLKFTPIWTRLFVPNKFFQIR